jgi:hypothetical protein
MGREKENAKMAKTYIVKVKADYSIEKVEFDETDSIAQLQEAVGGYIERVPTPLKNNLDLFVNEEGLLQKLPVNKTLSLMCTMGEGSVRILVGDGVFVCHDGESDTIGIDEDMADNLVCLLGDVAKGCKMIEAGKIGEQYDYEMCPSAEIEEMIASHRETIVK